MLRRILLWGAGALLVSGVAGFAAWGWLGPQLYKDKNRPLLETLDVYGEVPHFSLTERTGRRVTLNDLSGKVWVVNFFYTECTDTCPLQSANMARLQADFSAEGDLRLVSITVDPEHDTPQVLSEYAERFRADPDRWLLLTGPRDLIYRLAVEGFRLGVVDKKAELGTRKLGRWLGPTSAWAHPVPNPERPPIIHSSRFVLVDRRAQIRGYYQGTDWESLERLWQNVRILLRERPKET